VASDAAVCSGSIVMWLVVSFDAGAHNPMTYDNEADARADYDARNKPSPAACYEGNKRIADRMIEPPYVAIAKIIDTTLTSAL
jgi:hypothetical protein